MITSRSCANDERGKLRSCVAQIDSADAGLPESASCARFSMPISDSPPGSADPVGAALDALATGRADGSASNGMVATDEAALGAGAPDVSSGGADEGDAASMGACTVGAGAALGPRGWVAYHAA